MTEGGDLTSCVSVSGIACGLLTCRKLESWVSDILALFFPLLWESCCYPPLTQADLDSPGYLIEPSAPAPLLPDDGGATPGGSL